MRHTQSCFDVAHIEIRRFEHIYEDRPPIRGFELNLYDMDGNKLTSLTVTNKDETKYPDLLTPPEQQTLPL